MFKGPFLFLLIVSSTVVMGATHELSKSIYVETIWGRKGTKLNKIRLKSGTPVHYGLINGRNGYFVLYTDSKGIQRKIPIKGRALESVVTVENSHERDESKVFTNQPIVKRLKNLELEIPQGLPVTIEHGVTSQEKFVVKLSDGHQEYKLLLDRSQIVSEYELRQAEMQPIEKKPIIASDIKTKIQKDLKVVEDPPQDVPLLVGFKGISSERSESKDQSAAEILSTVIKPEREKQGSSMPLVCNPDSKDPGRIPVGADSNCIDYEEDFYKNFDVNSFRAKQQQLSSSERKKEFENTFAALAVHLMEKTGLPASLILSQAAIESGWLHAPGSYRSTNSLFGFSCFEKDKTYTTKVEYYDPSKEVTSKCSHPRPSNEGGYYRVYSSVLDGFYDYIHLLLFKPSTSKYYGRIRSAVESANLKDKRAELKDLVPGLNSYAASKLEYCKEIDEMVSKYACDVYNTAIVNFKEYDNKVLCQKTGDQ